MTNHDMSVGRILPKFVTPIEINEELRADRAILTVDGRMALTMTLRRGFPAPMRSTALDAFAFREGVLRRTRWELRGSGSRMRLGGARVPGVPRGRVGAGR